MWDSAAWFDSNGKKRTGYGLTSGHRLRWARDMAPALALLVVTFAFSFVQNDPAHSGTWQTACKAPLRFFRFALLLCAPLYILPMFYRFIVRKKAPVLLMTEAGGPLIISPLKHWICRPLQGIGIGLLFGTKLLTVLQLIAGLGVGTNSRP